MAERTPPFCCSGILPQTPFHKQDHYPRSYTCLLDFLTLATSLRAGRFPPTTPMKPLTEHDFVVRLCKGHTNPQFGANQWDAARYFLPDSSVKGGLIEVLDVENLEEQNRENRLEPLRGLLSTAAKGGAFRCFLFLEDVWMTALCPVHSDAVWFLQFWVKGPRDSEELGAVKKRVRDRRNGEEGLVEDVFTVRFCEMLGIPVRRPREEREKSPGEESLLDVVARGMPSVDVESWHDQAGDAEQRAHLQGYPEPVGELGIPPGLLPPQLVRQQRLFGNTRAEDSHSPAVFNTGAYGLGGNGMLHQHEAEPRNFPSRNQPHPFGAIGEPVPNRGYRTHDPPPRFLGTALQWEDPSLRAPNTPLPFALQPPPGFPYITNHRPTTTSAEPSRAEIDHWQQSNLRSPQPARHFDMGGMWQSPEFSSAQPAHPPGFLQPQGPGLQPGPYDVYPTEQPIPPQFSHSQCPESRLRNHNQGDWGDISHQAPLNSVDANLPFFSPPLPTSPGGPLDPNDPVYNIPPHNQHGHQTEADGPPTAPAAMRDTSAAGKSAYPPPAGNTSGLRPVPRRTWDIAKKEWRTYWVWAL